MPKVTHVPVGTWAEIDAWIARQGQLHPFLDKSQPIHIAPTS